MTIDVNQLTDLKDKLKSNIDEKNKVKAELQEFKNKYHTMKTYREELLKYKKKE